MKVAAVGTAKVLEAMQTLQPDGDTIRMFHDLAFSSTDLSVMVSGFSLLLPWDGLSVMSIAFRNWLDLQRKRNNDPTYSD